MESGLGRCGRAPGLGVAFGGKWHSDWEKEGGHYHEGQVGGQEVRGGRIRAGKCT